MRLPTDIDREDIRQWLSGCYVRTPVGIASVEALEGRELEVAPVDSDDYRMVHSADIRLWWPILGAINVPDVGGVFLRRRLVRQWRRSLYPRHVEIVVPGVWHVRTTNPRAAVLRWREVDRTTVRAIHRREYPADAREALSMLTDDMPTVALNPHLVLVRTKDPSLVYVYNELDYAGHIYNGEFKSSVGGANGRRVNKLIGGLG